MPEQNPTETVESLPEWAQTHIRELRSENAGYRSKNRDLETKVTDLTTSNEELQATVQLTDDTAKQHETDLASERFGRFRDREALTRGIPLELASKISAENEEDYTTALTSLAEWRGTPEAVKPAPVTDPAQVAEPAVDERQATADALFGNLN